MSLSEIFIQLLYMGMIAGYMVLAIMIARFLLRKRPKIYSYILWSLVAFRLLVPVSVTSSFSFFNLSYLPDLRSETIAENSDQLSGIITGDAPTKEPSKTEQPFAQSNPRQTAEQAERQKIEGVQNPQVEKPIDDQSEIIPPLQNDADMVPLTEGTITAGSKERLFEIGSVIWLLGVGVLLLYTLFKVISMRKQLASAVLWKDNIYEADGIKSPFVFGILRPRIYVPFSLEDVERDYILRHEKEHIRRGDHLVKYAAYLLAIAYWFHPLIWAAYYFMCQDMEMSCDEKVIRELDGEKRKDYSRILLSFATEKRQFAGPLYFGENNVEKRITNILKSKKGGIAAAVLGVVLIGVLVLFFATDAKKKDEQAAISANKDFARSGGQISIPNSIDTTDLEKNTETAETAVMPEEDLAEWVGEYNFKEEYFEEDYAPMFMDHSIRIYEEEGQYYADVDFSGQMAGVSLKAKVYGDREWISLMILEYYPEHVTGISELENNVVLSMRRQGEDIYTYWGLWTPLLDSNEVSGKIYLKKMADGETRMQESDEETESSTSWIGNYSFSEGFSESGGDLMFYDLSVYEENEQLFADLVIAGHNDTNIDVKAKVYGDDQWISLVLTGYNPGHAAGLERMENMVLLSLRRQGEAIYTYWGGWDITDLLLKEARIYYRSNAFFQKKEADDEKEGTSFFFPENTQTEKYHVITQYFAQDSQVPAETEVSVELMGSYDRGDLYEVKMDFHGGDSSIEYVSMRKGHNKSHLGYFYVQEDKIYRILDIDAEGIEDWSEEELISKGTIVCQSEPMEDKLAEGELGWHETIAVEGDICRYIGVEKTGANGYLFEGFVWEKGRGLIEYHTGHGGAKTEYIRIQITENTISDKNRIEEQEAAYRDYLTGWMKTSAGDLYLQNSYFLFKDVDGDGLEELCVRSTYMKRFFIVKYRDGALDVIYSIDSLNVHPYHENGESGLIYFEVGSVKIGDELKSMRLMSYATIDQNGSCQWSPLYVYWYDGEDKNVDLKEVADIPFEEVINMDWKEFHRMKGHLDDIDDTVTNPVYTYRPKVYF